MKKIASILLVAVLVTMCLAATAFASEEPQVVVETKAAAAGEEVTLTVSLVNNPGITNGSISYTFDEENLELVNLNTATMDAFMNGIQVMGNTANKTVVFVTTADFTADIVLFELTFKVKDGAVGDLAVGVSVNYIKNNAEEDIAFAPVAGAVTVACNCENLVAVEEVVGDCVNDGVKAHEKCEACGKLYIDGVEVTEEDVIVKAPGHNLVHIEAVEPGCHMTGNIEHWYCTVCDCVWADEALTMVTNHMSVVLPELGGELIHVEAKEATCTEEGNIEYWYCEECMQVWQDEARTQLTNIKNVVVPMVDHVDADGDELCDVCGGEMPVPETGDSIYVAVAAALLGVMGVAALTKKKEF